MMRQVGARETSVTAYEVSKTADDVKTGVSTQFRDKPGGCPPIGQAASGI
jgi:hypothetical protein